MNVRVLARPLRRNVEPNKREKVASRSRLVRKNKIKKLKLKNRVNFFILVFISH